MEAAEASRCYPVLREERRRRPGRILKMMRRPRLEGDTLDQFKLNIA